MSNKQSLLQARVYDAQGNPLGKGPVYSILRASLTDSLDKTGSFELECPAADVRVVDLLTEQRRIQLKRRNTVIFEGIVLTRSYQPGKGSGTFLIQGSDLMDELRTSRTVGQSLVHENVGLEKAMKDLAALATPAWSAVVVSSPDLVYGRYAGVSPLAIMLETVKQFGYHLRRDITQPRTVEIGPFGQYAGVVATNLRRLPPDAVSSTILGIVGELQYVRTSTQLVNRALPLGGGRGLSQLTLEHSDRTSPYPIKSRPRLDGSGLEYYIEDETSILAYGPHEEAPQDDTINPISNSDTDLTLAANALYDKTVQWLLRRKDPQVAYRVRCKTLPDSVRPGSLIWLRYKGLVMDGTQPVHFATVDAKFWVLAVTVTYTADARREYTLTVASVDAELADDTDLIVGRLKRLEVARAVPQPVPTKYTDTKEREIAPSHSVIIPIQISNAVLYLHRCILTLQTRPLRATALAAASGGGQVISSNEDGAHRHLVGVVSPDFPGPVNGASINFYRYEVYGILGNNDEGTVFVGDGGGAMWNPYPTYWYTSAADSGHQHSITLPNHTHGITYGIFDDTDHPRMISLSVNGSDMTSSLKDLNSNTYGPWQAANAPVELRFDLTEKLIADGVRRNHQIGVSCAAGQGTIESIVDALMTAQSVAVRPS